MIIEVSPKLPLTPPHVEFHIGSQLIKSTGQHISSHSPPWVLVVISLPPPKKMAYQTTNPFNPCQVARSFGSHSCQDPPRCMRNIRGTHTCSSSKKDAVFFCVPKRNCPKKNMRIFIGRREWVFFSGIVRTFFHRAF